MKVCKIVDQAKMKFGKMKVGKIVDWTKMLHWAKMKLGEKIGQNDSLGQTKVSKIIDWAK